MPALNRSKLKIILMVEMTMEMEMMVEMVTMEMMMVTIVNLKQLNQKSSPSLTSYNKNRYHPHIVTFI